MSHVLHWRNNLQTDTEIGLHQSPIVIHPSSATYDKDLEGNPVHMHYVRKNCSQLENNGYTVQANVTGIDSYLIGGPVKEMRSLVQFHFHWGATSEVGSEHQIGGKTYAAELHLVHWNSSKYASVQEAFPEPDGLTVLAVFLEVSKESHPGIQELIGYFPSVTYEGDRISIPAGFDPSHLLPEDRSRFWTYNGSLTTPPYYESVQFVIFKDTIKVSEKQMSAFRALRCGTRNDEELGNCCHLANNYRVCMPLNGRVVKSSFRDVHQMAA